MRLRRAKLASASTRASYILLLLAGGAAFGCGSEEDDKKTFVVRGTVVDPSGKGLAGALVTALDANDAPAAGTATSSANGAYELLIPSAKDGTPNVTTIKLRAAAAGFDTFPSGLRRSLPITLEGAVDDGDERVFTATATTIMLTPMANAAGMGSISGKVAGARRGALVVAEGPIAVSGISDVDGAYTLFNVPAGSYTVRGYVAGVQLEPAMVNVASAAVNNVDLKTRDVPTGKVNGTVSIVNAPGGSMTSIVLVVASTFNETLARGEVPPGLRAPGAGAPAITGAFTIEGVPDGTYVVLAAFENDGLVRDPDTSIGGTQIQRVTIGDGGRDKTLEAGFKITAALGVVGPGADLPEAMNGTPVFSWKDDSSEDRYSLELFDGKGNRVWMTDVAKVTGGDVSVPYSGPALTKGEYYQFRATSFRRGDVPIAQTEDLRGVFVMQ